jgi:DNA (cytosine-5)-methyltransferase 1
MPRTIETEFSLLRQRAGFADETGSSRRTVYRWENGETVPRKAALHLFHERVEGHKARFRFIDLFAGIGGLRRGFEPLGGECVFTSEWDRYSRKTYLANFACDHEFAGDITKVGASDIPAHDLLLAGFPCQPFSIAGVSKKNALNRPRVGIYSLHFMIH